MFEVPQSLSPSRVQGFLTCPLLFRFTSIEHLPEPPSVHTTRGTVVHRALELLFTAPSAQRTPARLAAAVDAAILEYRTHPDVVDLHLDDEQLAVLEQECRELAMNYLRMEDPTTVRDVGLELRLEATVGSLTLRGIIDRLDIDDDGELVVTDYKTGRSPSVNYEQQSLAGVHFYSFLCSEVLGRRPRAIRLLFLRSGETITARPTERSVRFLTTRTQAVWKAVETACRTGDFKPRQTSMCDGCAFREWCPAFGGDPSRAAVEAPLRHGPLAAA
jgi:putative RecB family exonuclease